MRESKNRSKVVYGFVKPLVDVHTMGMFSMGNMLRDCGYRVIMAQQDVNAAVENIQKLNNYSLFEKWIIDNNITRLGFSYRLDPKEGCDYFMALYSLLKSNNMLCEHGGSLELIAFAGLPETCSMIAGYTDGRVAVFAGEDTLSESLIKMGVSIEQISSAISQDIQYDTMRMDFAKKIIEREDWKDVQPIDHWSYSLCGTDNDTYVERLRYARQKQTLPIIRTHSGPYNPDRIEALKEYNSWCKELSKSRLLDVLSIGSSQLTQSNFGEDWDNRPNGGGVPINSALEYSIIRENAKPMLARTYSGTKNVPQLARIHESALNISWHALSFWWFNKLDGRGDNELLDNLREHFEAVKYIVTTGKPVEPNVPHHFAFRGSDDVSYIVSGFLAAKALKEMGVKHMILQNMLNTPKQTSGIQDLAKGRAMIKLVRELEDSNFSVSLQTRAGLDYFVPNMETAKVQLAAVTCMMDDLEPDNIHSPEIIHVVNYSEAVKLATPNIIKDSIKITLASLKAYRNAKLLGIVPNMRYDSEVQKRYDTLLGEARYAIDMLEKNIPYLYTPEGFYKVFVEGFFPVPYLLDNDHKYPKATMWQTSIINGGVVVVNEDGIEINTKDRYQYIINHMD